MTIAAVFRVPAADQATTIEHFAAKLAFETDVSDVRASLGVPGLVVVDTRGTDAWRQGHVPSAVHLPTDEIPTRALTEIDLSALVVTYCWGPGCNGATRAALAFASLGYRVKEMIGGYEYWVREGFETEGPLGLVQHDIDPLTAAAIGSRCAC